MGESLRKESEPDHTQKPEEQKSAEVIDINRAASRMAEKELDDFADYKALKTGHLTLAEYQRIMQATRNPDTNETLLASARVAADRADITLSPTELSLYSILRSDRDILSDLLHSDQQRLAEVLRITGRTADLQKLTDNHKHITF